MGCVKLHILDEQYKRTELRISYFNKELTPNFCAENLRSGMLVMRIDPDGNTDYYNLRGVMVRTVDDGSTDKKLLFTFAGMKKEAIITEYINNGQYVDVPSNEVVSKMEEAYKLTEKNGN